MKKYILILIFFLISIEIYSEEIEIRRDNGEPEGNCFIAKRYEWDESVAFKINAPCFIKKISIYLSGETPGLDTIWVCGDPAAGNLFPTLYVWKYNSLIPPIAYNYDGVAGWKEFDISSYNLRLNGYESIAIQHRLKQDGPWFSYDSDGRTTDKASGKTSWLTDPYTPNPNFYNIKGTIYEYPAGDFLVRLYIEYQYPDGNGYEAPPPPTFVNINAETQISISGNPAIVDWNNDGWDDISCNGKFYENNQDGTFTEKSSQFGIGGGSYSWADVDNNGYLDAFVVRGWNNDKIYANQGNGVFTDITSTTEITNNYPTETPVWFDSDNDGTLDLFIANRRKEENGQETYYPNQLWVNSGNGQFINATNEAGIAAAEPSPYYDLYGATAVDYNKDNAADIFVATYRLAPDLLYKNDTQGYFNDVAKETGVVGLQTALPYYFGHGMGCHWGDFNNDGYIDLCVGNLAHLDERGTYSNPSLIFRNDGPPNFHFTELGNEMGLRFHEGNAGAIWLDLDLDGYLDLWHGKYAGGIGSLYLNQGPPNFKLQDITWETNAVIQNPWTAVYSDLDNDGDLDMVINNNVLRNDMERKGNWAAFRVQGAPQDNVNQDGYGTKITAFIADKIFFRELSSSAAGSRATQNTNELHFGLGFNDIIDSIVVVYPNGKSITHSVIKTNARYFIPYLQAPEIKILSTPALIQPKNYSNRIQTDKPVFDWTKVEGAVRYRFQVSKSMDFSTIIINETIEESAYYLAQLKDQTQYYWRVRAYSQTDSSRWSSVWEFYTGTPAPSSPSLILPANNEVNVNFKPKFIWSNVSYLTKYLNKTYFTFELSTDADFNNTFRVFENLRDTVFIFDENLEINTEYFWRVIPINIDLQGEPSETFKFKTISLPAVPVLESPQNNEADVIIRPYFNWKTVDYADSYQIQISQFDDFSEIIYDNSEVYSNTLKLLKSLDGSTTYYWQIRALNLAGASVWSETWSFTTILIPRTLNLVYPSNEMEEVPTTFSFNWDESLNSLYYQLQVANNLSFTNCVIEADSLTLTEFNFSTALDKGTTYYWRARGKNDVGNGVWSETWSFKTEGASDVFEDKFNNNLFSLLISPNPFKDNLLINFSLFKQSYVNISIINVFGETVHTFYDGELSQSSYIYNWQPISISEAVYFLKIFTNEKQNIYKLIYLK